MAGTTEKIIMAAGATGRALWTVEGVVSILVAVAGLAVLLGFTHAETEVGYWLLVGSGVAFPSGRWLKRRGS